MTEPLVSVKMITYNHAPSIAQAIEGVLQQKTIFPFELVIGEDCSTDGTREIVFEYQKKYPDIIRVITSDKNVGMTKNGYRTGKACRGKYVAFCEGDDFWHRDDKLQIQIDYLESHPECGLIFADCDFYDVSAKKLIKDFNYKRGFESSGNLTVEQILRKWGAWTLTAVIRKDLYDQVVEKDPYLHQSGTFLMGDLQLWTEIALISKVAYITESLATYRSLDESASNTRDQKKHLRFWKSYHEMKLYLCDKHGFPEDIRKEAEAAWFDKTLQLAFYERNAELALEVRKKKQTFTWKEWIRYFGAKHFTIYYGVCAAIQFLNLFKKKQQDLFS